MKNSLSTFILFMFVLLLYSQQTNTGFVVEYNELLNVQFEIYEPPLKIERVDTKEQINYSRIEGLLKSYISATNLEWAKSEYISDDMIVVRDSTHFNSIKSSSKNSYIQLENIYKFEYQNRDMAFVRYSQIFEKLPFPIISIFSMEKLNNRWYFSNLLNQDSVYYILQKFKNSFILDCLKGSSSNPIWNKIIEKSRNEKSNIILDLLHKNLINLKIQDINNYNSILDEKQLDEKFDFRNAEKNVSSKSYEFSNVYHPFVFDNFRLEFYENAKEDIVLDEKTKSKYRDKPELLILSKTPVTFIFKANIFDQNSFVSVIKYKKGNKIFVEKILKEGNNFSKLKGSKYPAISDLILKYNSDLLKKIFYKKLDPVVMNFIKNDTGGINIDLFLLYLNKSPEKFNKYLSN